MRPRLLSPVGGSLIALLSIALACSSTSVPEGDGSGGSSSSPSKEEGGKSGGAGGAKTGSGGATASGGSKATGGGSATGGATAAGGRNGDAGSSASGGGGAGPTTGAGGKGKGGAGGKAGRGGADTAGNHDGTGGKDPGGTGGKAGQGGTPDAGPHGDGGSTPGAGGSSSDAGSTGGGKSAGCGKTPTITQYNKGQPIAITVGSQQRRYVLNVPTKYDNTKPYKLIVTIHQLDGNDKQMYNWQYYGLLPLSNDTVIFAAPNGQKNGSPCSGTGDGDSGCGWPNSSGQDMALMDAVVAQVEENFCVDTNRIFATGWSYGASMSYEVGCERPLGGTKASWGVRAISIYSGSQMSGSCKPSLPVAFFGAHGTNDNVLGYDRGLSLAQNFAKANGCTWATPAKASGAHVCTNVTGCKDGYSTEFCSFVGGHTPFPDSGQAQGSWGPQESWKFLSQF